LSVIFGPAPSRRLGYSLGIDVISPELKMCSLDCVYCQVGHTKTKTIERGEPVPTALILKEIDQALPKAGIHYVTFSGSGEPTLHKNLGKLIDRVHERCKTPVAVITNGTLLDRADVQRDLLKAELVVPSLDAATPEVFARLNRPHPSLRLDRMIKGLIQFSQQYHGQLWVEVMLVKGVNDGIDELRKIKAVLDQVNLQKIHLNTVIRPPTEDWAQPLSPAELDRIAAMFGPRAQTVGLPPKQHAEQLGGENLDAEVFELIQRRSVTLADLVDSLGLHRDVAQDIVDRLIAEKRIKKVVFGGVSYYREFY
jgi:wyosine [tRNA(Phe)-imidazoG37] synthetase (radical SAM superfamily)